MVVNARAVDVKLRIEGIRVEPCLVMVEHLLAVVERKLVVHGGLFWNGLESTLGASRPVRGRMALGVGEGGGEGGESPFLIKKRERRSTTLEGLERARERGTALSSAARGVCEAARGWSPRKGRSLFLGPAGAIRKERAGRQV
jgi:hypothetical protein